MAAGAISIVLDASAALSWFKPDEASDEAGLQKSIEQITGSPSYVPGNFYTEVTNALVRAERNNAIERPMAGAVLTQILSLNLQIIHPDPHLILGIARKHTITCYDAAYIAAAIEVGGRLITIDKVLQKAARNECVLR